MGNMGFEKASACVKETRAKKEKSDTGWNRKRVVGCVCGRRRDGTGEHGCTHQELQNLFENPVF